MGMALPNVAHAVLTGVVMALYVASVLLIQAGYRAITGQQADLMHIIATLVIAFLLYPARRRIQASIEGAFDLCGDNGRAHCHVGRSARLTRRRC
jgi:hypothetical protein